MHLSVCLGRISYETAGWIWLSFCTATKEGLSVSGSCVCVSHVGGDRPRDLVRRAENVVFLCRQSTMILWQSFLIRSLGNAVALICGRHRVLSQTCSVAHMLFATVFFFLFIYPVYTPAVNTCMSFVLI